MSISICINCEKRIALDCDYYGFCNMSCCGDYAHRNDLTIECSKKRESYEKSIELEELVEELEEKIEQLRDDADCYEDGESAALIRCEELVFENEKVTKENRTMTEKNKALYKENKQLLDCIKRGGALERFKLLYLTEELEDE